MKELSEILTRSLSERLFQSATFRAFDLDSTLVDYSAGECGGSSLFDVASLTKIFTALIFTKMRADGLISEDSKLEQLPFPTLPVDKRGVTLLSLLTHTSGFPEYEPFYKLFVDDSGKIVLSRRSEAKEQITLSILGMPLKGGPSEKILYSDPGYILLGDVMETLGVSTLDALLETYVTGPLGLVDTCFRPLAHLHNCETGRIVSTGHSPLVSRELIGEVWDLNSYVLGGISGHAGMFSTATDLEKFSRELFRVHRGEKSFIGDRDLAFLMGEVRDQFGKRRRVGFDVPSGEDSLAGRYFSENSAGHLGFTGVSLWLDFEMCTGMVFLSNRVYYKGDREKFNLARRKIHDAAWELIGL